MSLQRRRTQSLPLKFSSTGLARTSKRSQSLLLLSSLFHKKSKNLDTSAVRVVELYSESGEFT